MLHHLYSHLSHYTNMILTVNYSLIKIKTIKVEGHSINTQSSELDTYHRPSSQEKKYKERELLKLAYLIKGL
jgi:hypothetical protein